MSMIHAEDLQKLITGDVVDDAETRSRYSRDTSLFARTPSMVVFPKDANDVQSVVKYVHDAKARGEDISLTPRSAGTDMTGGPLTTSIALVFTKYMNHIGDITPDAATAEPGVYYRDYEKATLASTGKITPSYPASRELCAIGGMVSNNSGGELTLRYGKTNDYVRSLNVVLSDGSAITVRPLSPEELAHKKSQQDLEGQIYRDVSQLIDTHFDEIQAARPSVTKNSAGYALWNVRKPGSDTFDLTQLITGSQGSLAIVTEATLGLVKTKEHRAMLVVFLNDLDILPEIVKRVLVQKPETFESFDDQTFKLAVRFMPQLIGQLGFAQMIKLGLAFMPEVWMTITGGVPKLILMAEFAEDTHEEALAKAHAARGALDGLAVKTTIAKSEIESEKYWRIRRESFALLRKNVHGLYAAPFIDDMVVHPLDYPTFLPELNAILKEFDLFYTIAGHIGDGNFHIIPLMDLTKPEQRKAIIDLQPRVYELVRKYKGSTTGEHNDGIIRTPFLPYVFSQNILDLFAETKKIFDPLNILNPGKKVGGTIADIEESMITHV